MNLVCQIRPRLAALALTAMLAAGQALADRPPWAGNGQYDSRGEDRYENRYDRHEGRREHRQERRRDDYRGAPIDFRFDDRSRGAVNDYYGDRFRRGHCPPGLAKKHNGCMPPGQARQWERGRPLPRGVVYYDLPPAVVGYLPPPPPRHRYVRVASDILLIAVGSAMVVDAIEDIGRLP
ncbi:MAG TPA: hypothetical protein VFF82_01305 [Rhodocyclaceae bacterium]|nr:hypothetical protein [Rhodocyclaceae bacterium]